MHHKLHHAALEKLSLAIALASALGLSACADEKAMQAGNTAGTFAGTAGFGAGTGFAGTGFAGTGVAGTGVAGTGFAGTGVAGTGVAGTGFAGTGVAGSGVAGTGAAGSGAGAIDPCGVGLDAPADGFQVCSKGTMIPSEADVEYCEVVTLPGTPSDKYYVGRTETQMTPYSHHLIILAANPGSQNEAGMQDGERVPCTGGEQAFGDGMQHVTGAQHPYGDVQYPEGVGKIYYGGQKLSFDYHYFNVSDAPVMARAALNMHLVDEANVEHIARQFGFYNFGIFTQQGQTGSFTKACTFSGPIVVWSLTRHTHKWGTDFIVNWEKGANDGQHLWTSTDWETDTNFPMPGGPLTMTAGTGFEFTCQYNNTSDHLLRFGTNATDEMCILFGTYWKVNESDTTAIRAAADSVAQPRAAAAKRA